jgi:copper oxidase (laccase) domain-containing protein
VTGAALAAMTALGARPGRVIAGIGPAIGPDRYQVGEEVMEAARECFGEATPLAIQPDGTGRWLFDLWAANRIVLTEAGVAGEHIHLAAVGTGPPGPFFSNRTARPGGRFGLFARLLPRDGGP